MDADTNCHFLCNFFDIKRDGRIYEAFRMSTSHYKVWVLGIACYLRVENIAVANVAKSLNMLIYIGHFH